MVGRLGILEARDYTKTNLGDKFNLKDFHFQVTHRNYIITLIRLRDPLIPDEVNIFNKPNRNSWQAKLNLWLSKKLPTTILKRINFTLLCRFCHKDHHPLLSSKITLRITSSAWRNLTTMGVPIFWILLRELHPRKVIRNLECTSTLKLTGIMLKARSFPLQRACWRT